MPTWEWQPRQRPSRPLTCCRSNADHTSGIAASSTAKGQSGCASSSPDLAVDQLFGPLFFRRLLANRPIPDGYVRDVVDAFLRAHEKENR